MSIHLWQTPCDCHNWLEYFRWWIKIVGISIIVVPFNEEYNNSYSMRCLNKWTGILEFSIPGPSVVRKRISANPRLNQHNPRSKFDLWFNSVPWRMISTIQRLNYGLNLTHLARWINSLIGWKSSQTNQNGRLTLCWFCFNPEPDEERKAIQATWRFFWIWFYNSLTDEPFHIRFSHAFSSSHITDKPLFGDPENVLHDEGEARNSTLTSDLRGRNRCLLAAVM